MKKINVFYGIIFKRVMLELSGLCCYSTYGLEASFLHLMSYGNLFEKDALLIEPIARAGMNAMSTRLERATIERSNPSCSCWD